MKSAVPVINANMLTKALAVPANRITAILKRQRGITGDTARSFYAHLDFLPSPSDPLHLFMLLKDACRIVF